MNFDRYRTLNLEFDKAIRREGRAQDQSLGPSSLAETSKYKAHSTKYKSFNLKIKDWVRSKLFRFTTAGESHGRALVAIVEGLPAGLPISVDQINHELKRRQWGYGRGGRMKIEQDAVEILSGLRHGLTLGSPLAMVINNKDWENWSEVMAPAASSLPPEKMRSLKRPRPGHADLAGGQKFARARSAQCAGAGLGARNNFTSGLRRPRKTIVSYVWR